MYSTQQLSWNVVATLVCGKNDNIKRRLAFDVSLNVKKKIADVGTKLSWKNKLKKTHRRDQAWIE